MAQPDQNMISRRSRLTRFVDLILPPLPTSVVDSSKGGDRALQDLIAGLERSGRTGCVRATSEERFSRSAMLLYRGRAVGCIHNCRSKPFPQKTEEALKLMIGDLSLPDTVVSLYDLPEEIVLPVSALFLSTTERRDDNYDAKTYMDYSCVLLKGREQTACFAYTFPLKKATCLGFVYKGDWVGAFNIAEQKFDKDKEFIYALMQSDVEAYVDLSILPANYAHSQLGFSLSEMRS